MQWIFSKIPCYFLCLHTISFKVPITPAANFQSLLEYKKKHFGVWATENSCTTKCFSPLCPKDGDASPRPAAGSLRGHRAWRVHSKSIALPHLVASSSTIPSLMGKAGESSKGLSHYLIYRRWGFWILSWEGTLIFIFVSKFFNRLWRGTGPICLAASYSIAESDPELLGCRRGFVTKVPHDFPQVALHLCTVISPPSLSLLSQSMA